MNRAEQAQKGFKTFILTLSISLIVFSAVYYAVTNYSNFQSAVPDIELEEASASDTSVAEPGTVFGQLASQKIDNISQMAVLAGSDIAEGTTETTQGTGTPEGGIVSITTGLIASASVFSFGMFIIACDPRKLALHSFERKITRN